MSKKTTIADRIEVFVKQMDGAAVCDDCITDRLDLSSIAQVAVFTHAVDGSGGFERLKAVCGLCAQPKLVLRHMPQRFCAASNRAENHLTAITPPG